MEDRSIVVIMDKRIVKDSIYSVIRSLGSFLFPVITFSYASRIFLADGIGKINFARSTISIISMISMLGITLYGIRECAKRRDDKEALSKLFSELLSINLISTALSYVILFIFVESSSKAGEYKSEIYLFSTGILLNVIGVGWLYTGVGDYRYLAVRSLIVQLISLLAVVAFVHRKEDISTYIIICVTASGGSNIIAFFHARKYVHVRKIRFRDLWFHIKPIFNIFLVTIFISIFTDMDTVMVGFLSTETEVGLYSASYKISAILCKIISSATTIIMPRIAYDFEKREDNKANELLKTSIQYICLVGLPLAVGSCVYSRNFIALLSGESFNKATLSSEILSIRSLISPINCMLLLNYLIPRNNDKEAIVISFVAALGNVVLNACLIPLYGAVGASIGTVVAEIIEFIVMSKYIRKHTKFSFIFENAFHYTVAVLPVTIVSIATLSIKHDIFSIVLGVAISVPIYAIILRLLKNQYFESGLSMIKGMLVHRHKHNQSVQ